MFVAGPKFRLLPSWLFWGGEGHLVPDAARHPGPEGTRTSGASPGTPGEGTGGEGGQDKNKKRPRILICLHIGVALMGGA